MDRIKFMIDSGSDIPPEVADALDAEVVPLYRVIDGVPVLDYHDFNIQDTVADYGFYDQAHLLNFFKKYHSTQGLSFFSKTKQR